MKQAHRFSGTGKAFEGLTHLGPNGPTWTGDIRLMPEKLGDPLRWRRPRRIFVNSMSDMFHPDVPNDYIDKMFAVMALCQQHTFQVLTKRPERMLDCSQRITDGLNVGLAHAFANHRPMPDQDWRWPLPNVWLGTSVENQPMYDQRIGPLLRTPAAVRFLSVEPMLEYIDLRMGGMSMPDYSAHNALPKLDWVIVGGESGRGARPFNVAWARSIVRQCKAAGVACFVKQLGAKPFESYTDGPFHVELDLKSAKGGDMAWWPADLRVREMPE